MRLVLICAALAACNEYDLGEKPGPDGATTTTAPADPTTPADPPETTSATLPVLPCDDAYSDTMPWVKSPNWVDTLEPIDADGNEWFETAYDTPTDWLALGALPDEDGDASDNDVFYRAEFQLDGVVGTTEISFVGNDGVWLYVNDGFVGHWGGEWREGGCINVPHGCHVNYDAPPVDVTSLLTEGRNVIAVMLTNGPKGYSLDIDATCVH